MKVIKPLFMWAGGKNKMIKNYLAHMPEKVSTYSEPFFGGGAMYIYMQQNFAPEKCYINDTNEESSKSTNQLKATHWVLSRF